MRVTDTMRAELAEFRAIRLGLIACDVPAVIADTLAREAVEDMRNALPRDIPKLRDPQFIIASIRAETLRGL